MHETGCGFVAFLFKNFPVWLISGADPGLSFISSKIIKKQLFKTSHTQNTGLLGTVAEVYEAKRD
jgi:hypothetical protein